MHSIIISAPIPHGYTNVVVNLKRFCFMGLRMSIRVWVVFLSNTLKGGTVLHSLVNKCKVHVLCKLQEQTTCMCINKLSEHIRMCFISNCFIVVVKF